MPLPRWPATLARSVLALLLAVAAVPAVNLGGGALSDALGLPPGGTWRLAVDLSWVFVAGVAGSALAVRVAAVAKTAHAWAVFALYLAVGLAVAVAAWDDFPRWFTLACLLSLPLQAWLGWWLAWGRRRGG